MLNVVWFYVRSVSYTHLDVYKRQVVYVCHVFTGLCAVGFMCCICNKFIPGCICPLKIYSSWKNITTAIAMIKMTKHVCTLRAHMCVPECVLESMQAIRPRTDTQYTDSQTASQDICWLKRWGSHMRERTRMRVESMRGMYLHWPQHANCAPACVGHQMGVCECDAHVLIVTIRVAKVSLPRVFQSV